MKLSGIASVLGLALALCAPNIGCEDDNTLPKRDAGTDAKDARASDGPAGTDGSTDRTVPDAGPDVVTDAPATDAPAGSTDAPATLDGNTDRPIDTAPTPDTATPDTTLTPDTSPDTGPTSDGPIAVESCDEVVCPALFDVSNTCNGDEQACQVNETATDPNTVRAICFANGVKKIATDTSPSDGVTLTSLVVTKPGGAACYNLEVTDPETGPQTWVFKSTTGTELGRATVNEESGDTFFTCTATGTVYNITGTGCAGMEGEGDGCTDSTTCN